MGDYRLERRSRALNSTYFPGLFGRYNKTLHVKHCAVHGPVITSCCPSQHRQHITTATTKAAIISLGWETCAWHLQWLTQTQFPPCAPHPLLLHLFPMRFPNLCQMNKRDVLCSVLPTPIPRNS